MKFIAAFTASLLLLLFVAALLLPSNTFYADPSKRHLRSLYQRDRGIEAAFGHPIEKDYANTIQIMNIPDFDADQWGWFIEIDSFVGAESFDFKVYAGKEEEDTSRGTYYIGDVTVNVAECTTADSNTDWYLGNAESKVCVKVDEIEGKHVHVADSLPFQEGSTTFSPGQYEEMCCTIGKPCYVIVNAFIDQLRSAGCNNCNPV